MSFFFLTSCTSSGNWGVINTASGKWCLCSTLVCVRMADLSLKLCSLATMGQGLGGLAGLHDSREVLLGELLQTWDLNHLPLAFLINLFLPVQNLHHYHLLSHYESVYSDASFWFSIQHILFQQHDCFALFYDNTGEKFDISEEVIYFDLVRLYFCCRCKEFLR